MPKREKIFRCWLGGKLLKYPILRLFFADSLFAKCGGIASKGRSGSG